MTIKKNSPKPSLLMELVSIALQNTVIRDVLDKFPPDFEEIFTTRIKYKMENLSLFLRHFVDDKDMKDGTLDTPKLIKNLIIKEFEYLETEPTFFKKKYGCDMIKTVNEAKYAGTDSNKIQLIDDAILCLIKWDKAWLTVTSFRSILIDRQYSGDSLFYKNLGRIVAQKTDSMKKTNTNHGILWLVEQYGMVLDLKSTKNRNQLHKVMEAQGYFDDPKDVNPLSDIDYFNKQLKRHRII
jgi:hypothetical protein